MSYASLDFLLLFPAFFLLYRLVPGHTVRLALLFLASLAFYVYGEPRGLPILLAVIAGTYLTGLAMERWPRRTALIAAAGIAALIVDLAFFKYSGFLAGFVPGTSGDIQPLLPLGISFFTFEAIAYIVDVRRGTTRVERSPLRLALYVSVFPHLISGPIMRPEQLIPQLRTRIHLHAAGFVSGLQLFTEGFVKKRLLADPAGSVADLVFAAPPDASMAAAWIGALAYTLQIYGDFAGYTDMGRGIARMIGLELPKNFDAPYAATSITDFWRRWHISLSSWLRDYLYIGLGGNRKGPARTYVNLIVTMLLGGLWHGAGWTFVAWGGYHGVLLAFERWTGWTRRVPGWAVGAITLFLVVNGWVLFRAQDGGTFVQMLSALYVPHDGALVMGVRGAAFVVIAFALVVGSMLAARLVPERLASLRRPDVARALAYGAAAGIVLLAAPTAARPFIYFRF